MRQTSLPQVIRTNLVSSPLITVTSTAKEPVIGWIDNLYGPTGVVAGVGTGILRTMHCDRDINANIVPVDMTVNALITCAWDIANRYSTGINHSSLSDSNYFSSSELITSSCTERSCAEESSNNRYYSNSNAATTIDPMDEMNNNSVYTKVGQQPAVTPATDIDDGTHQQAAAHLESVPIYNYVSSVQNPLTWGEFTELNIKHGFEFPFSNAIW